MLTKLQRKTLVPAQIIGYVLTLLVGVSILLLALQAYSDFKQLLTEQSDVFAPHSVVVSKDISILNTLNKGGIYFEESELDELRHQEFIKDVVEFKSATFSPSAEFHSGSIGNLHTEMFFESISDRYVDVQTEFGEWDSNSNFIPIIIPEDFLNLYNFCFAESQSLPVISKNTMKRISFSIVLEGNGLQQVFNSRIVGFSSKIKTILVPEKFMDWANKKFGNTDNRRTNRLLVEFSNANDERIPTFFKDHGYSIDKSELEYSKMSFFLKLALTFVIAIAVIIIMLSLSFIVMSLNLIIQRNRQMLKYLYNLGYTPTQMAKFYQGVVSAVTLFDVILSVVIAIRIRTLYLEQLSSMFEKPDNPVNVWLCAFGVLAVLLVVCNYSIWRNIKKRIVA